MNQVENYLLAVMDGNAGAIQRSFQDVRGISDLIELLKFFSKQYASHTLIHPGPLVDEMSIWIAVRFPWVGENEKPEKW